MNECTICGAQVVERTLGPYALGKFIDSAGFEDSSHPYPHKHTTLEQDDE